MPSCRTDARKAAVAVLLIIISEWHHLGSGGLYNLPAASGQQLQDSLPLGTSWTAQSLPYITSPAKTFCFGWLRFPNASLNFYVAVWYGALDRSIVWVANRNSPAAANDTLQVTSDGNLLLLSAASSHSIVWQTNTASQPVSALEILDSGNVVLVDKNGFYSWQSFSFPTDTLLPTQSLLVNAALVSRRPASSPSLASGNFKFYIKDSLPAIDHISASGQSINNIWQAASAVFVQVDAVNSSAIAAQFLASGVFCTYYLQSGSAYSQLVPSDYGSIAPTGSGGIIRRLTLDLDGQLRMYGWDYVSDSWVVLSEAISNFCSLLAFRGAPACGPYGVCLDAPNPACVCPPGFRPTDINDVTGGCSRVNVPLPSCQNNQPSINSSATTYLVLSNTDFVGNDILFQQPISLADCQSLCTSICSCMGVIYNTVGAASCWLKSALTNGYSPQIQTGSRDAYIKLQNSTTFPVINPPVQSPTLAWTNSSTFGSQACLQSNNLTYCGPAGVINTVSTCPANSHIYVTKIASNVQIAVVSLSELLCFLLVLLVFWKAKIWGGERKESPTQHAVCRAFTYAELVEATDHFRYPLGSGSFGVVFKGVLSEGTEIAVKRLQTNVLQTADAQFRAEIATLGRIHHLNLLCLIGFCAEGLDHRLLVYEFMQNGSLNKVLFDNGSENGAATEGSGDQRKPHLNWKTRYSICLGTARGLAYLHEDCLDCIVHCDINPGKILLDRQFCPRVADFGLASLFGRNEMVEVSNLRGTQGYLAPEWVTTNMPITAKADVFSFGMVLIELVTGRRNFQFFPSATAADTLDYPKWAFREVQKGRLEKVMDRRIRARVVEEDAAYREAERVLRIAFMCLHREADARPGMRSIVQMLEGSISVPPLPDGPGSFHDPAESAVADPDDA